MSRIAYVNGRYRPARGGDGISVDDRAFTFGDGVYEVCEISGGSADRGSAPSRAARAFARGRAYGLADRERRRCGWSCARSCGCNRVRDGLVYLQVSRGAARRDHGFPASRCEARAGRRRPIARPGCHCCEGGRRHRRHYAAGQPMGASGHQDASACCRTCWPSRPRGKRARSRRGSSTRPDSSPKALRPTPGSSLPMAPSSPGRRMTTILHGVTRATLIDIAQALGLRFEERPFTPQEAQGAREAFLSLARRPSPCRSCRSTASRSGRDDLARSLLRFDAAFHEQR